jgi:capsular polysaccharide transport system permease protein
MNQWLKWVRANLLFALTVIVPMAVAIVYFGFVASDVYVSESKVVVRSPEKRVGSPIGELLKGVGFVKAQDDTYLVQDYILSRDALNVLESQMKIGEAFRRPGVDIFSRFAGIDPDDSFEALYRYYQRRVSVSTDTASSISTLSVRAFTASDAFNANRILLTQSEELVNRVNERGRNDTIRYASAEVANAKQMAVAAALAVSSYRASQSVVDPERQATAQLQRVAKLQDDLIATTAQLSQLKKFTPENTQIPALANMANTLELEIAKESSKVTGGQASLANKAGRFQQLALESDFANKQLASALTSLEAARNDAQRQQVYLERVAQPNLPDVAQEPRRFRSIAATLIICLAVWGILSMLIAGVREHQD